MYNTLSLTQLDNAQTFLLSKRLEKSYALKILVNTGKPGNEILLINVMWLEKFSGVNMAKSECTLDTL